MTRNGRPVLAKEQALRRYICRTCGADRGKPCIASSGRPSSSAHKARFIDACAAGAVELKDAEVVDLTAVEVTVS